MKKITKFFCLLLASLIPLLSVGCANGYSPNKVIDLLRFNTAVHVETYGKAISAETKNKISNLLTELEKEFSLNEVGSAVNRFNDQPQNLSVTFSEQGYALLKLAKDYTKKTDGKFNLAVYPLVKLWGVASEDYPVQNFALPTADGIDGAKNLSNPDYVLINDLDKTAQKTVDGVKIDLGGIAKGYAVDKVLDILKTDGHTDGYISVGSSSMFVLSLKNRYNTFSIRHPENLENTILSFAKDTVQNTAISTSGDYERYYELNGKRYSHVIDTKTGAPTETGIISASVLGGTACFADALTTALMLCEYDVNDSKNSELVKFINKILIDYPDLKFFVFYKKDGVKRLITNGTTRFTLNDQSFSVVNI